MKRRLLSVFFFFFFFSSCLSAASLIRINEVAPNETDSADWIELYSATDTVNLNGWKIVERAVVKKTVSADLTPAVGDYIVLHATTTDPTGLDESDGTGKGANGVWDLYVSTTDGKLYGYTSDNIILLEDSGSNIKDAVIWVNARADNFTSACEAPYNDAISAGQWSGESATGTNDAMVEIWCAPPPTSTGSLGRDSSSTDNDGTADWIAKNDWHRQNSKTMGASNDLTGIDITAPAAITDLAVYQIGTSSVTLQWTAPGDDGNTGTVTRYFVRYKASAMNDQAGFFTGTDFDTLHWSSLAAAHNQETRAVTGLQTATTYWFLIEAEDDANAYNQGGPPTNTPISCLTNEDPVPPDAVTDLATSVSSSTVGAVQLQWTAPGDDGTTGTASLYDIRYATYSASGDTTSWWNNAETVRPPWGSEPSPAAPHTTELFVISGLPSGSTVYFHIKTRDESPTGWSAIDSGSEDYVYVPRHLLLSEICFDTSLTSDTSSFVELYNPTLGAINLTDWQIKAINGSGGGTLQTVDLSGSINSEGFFLVGDVATVWGKAADQVAASLGSNMQNGDDGVQLLYKGSVVDVIGYDGGSSDVDTFYEKGLYPDTAVDQSIERKSAAVHNEYGGNGYDTNDNANDLRTRTTPQPQNTSSTEIPDINMTVTLSTSTSSQQPGKDVTYTLTYGNSGTDPATGFTITQVVPANTYISEDAATGSADSREYYVGSSWQGTYSADATRIRWTDNSVPGSSSGLTVSFKAAIK